MIYFLRKLFCLHAYEFEYCPDCGYTQECRKCGKKDDQVILHLAKRITAYETPLNMHYWRGFLFLLGGEDGLYRSCACIVLGWIHNVL